MITLENHQNKKIDISRRSTKFHRTITNKYFQVLFIKLEINLLIFTNRIIKIEKVAR